MLHMLLLSITVLAVANDSGEAIVGAEHDDMIGAGVGTTGDGTGAGDFVTEEDVFPKK